MFDYSTITTIIYFWIAKSGDAYISSWINTLFYGFTFVTAIYKWKNLKRNQASYGDRYFWLFLIFVLFVLGVNKQFDFQTTLIEAGRSVAQHGNWYENRRIVQAWFAYSLLSVVVIFAFIMLVRLSTKKFWRNNAIASLGFVVLCVYMLARTTTTSHVGFITDSKSEGEFRFTDIIEFFGILFIFLNTLTKHKTGNKETSKTIKWNYKLLWGLPILIGIGVLAFLIFQCRSYIDNLVIEVHSLIGVHNFAVGNWSPAIGDPSFMGWFTVYSYYFTAVVFFLKLFIQRVKQQRQERIFWLFMCISMIVLGVIKQFNLLQAVDEILRIIARSTGWIEERRIIQAVVMIIVGVVSLLTIIHFMRKSAAGHHKITTIGFYYLLLFVMFRGISLHQYESLLRYKILGARVNWIGELLGIYWVCVSTFLTFKTIAPSRQSKEVFVKSGINDDVQNVTSEPEKKIEAHPPGSVEAFLDRADACEKLGDYRMMLKESSRAVELNPEDARAHASLGFANAMLGEYEKSIKNFKVAAQLGHEESQEALKKMGIDW